MIQIGLLGASRIAPIAVIEPARDLPGVDVVAVAASDPDRAAQFARQHGIDDVEADYAGLIAHPRVDVVYIGLPPSAHAAWAVRALEAGKHVLCEKPFAMNAAEARDMTAAAEAADRHLLEAFHYRFHPVFSEFLERLASGSLGAIERIDCHFNGRITYSASELRYRPDLGGGALMDLGCYPLHWLRTITGEEPQVRSAAAEWHAGGVDESMRAELEFPGGVTASLGTSMSTQAKGGFDAAVTVHCRNGKLTLSNPLFPSRGYELIEEGGGTDGTGKERKSGEGGQSTYYYQLRHLIDVLDGKQRPLTGGDDAVNNMRAIDAIYRAAGRPSEAAE